MKAWVTGLTRTLNCAIKHQLCLRDCIKLHWSQGIVLHFVSEILIEGSKQLFLVISVNTNPSMISGFLSSSVFLFFCCKLQSPLEDTVFKILLIENLNSLASAQVKLNVFRSLQVNWLVIPCHLFLLVSVCQMHVYFSASIDCQEHKSLKLLKYLL